MTGRSFIVHDVDQRSPEWRKLRAGRLTASVAAKMMATRKDKTEAADRRDLRTQLVCELLTGEPQEDAFLSKDMQRGIETEPEAFAAYELATSTVVQKVGFITHREIAAGCSPDGIIGDFEGGLELKCPRAANHLGYLRSGKLPSDYVYQIAHSLWLTGLPWWDFASYCAQFPEPLRLFRLRVYRDEAQVASYELMLRAFLAEVEQEVESVKALMSAGAVA
jgi:hypothetical protein